jgi:ATP-dependent Clp protease ATP-binding subunit ClpA
LLHHRFDYALLDISRRFVADTAVHVVPEDDHSKAEQGPNKAVGGKSTDKTAFREPIGNYLQNYGRDLTLDAENGLIDPLIGREDVLERTLAILLRRTKNNPILLGDPGVGKTAIAEGIA